MATKLVRFARVKGKHSHYGGHYPFPRIDEGDTIQFVSRYLRVVLTFKKAARKLFREEVTQLVITPSFQKESKPASLTAACAMELEAELRKSNILVTVTDEQHKGNPNGGLNYGYNAWIDPCE